MIRPLAILAAIACVIRGFQGLDLGLIAEPALCFGLAAALVLAASLPIRGQA